MELVIGMRGHAQMIPFGLNTKIIAKTEDILEKNTTFVEQKLLEKQNMLFEITQANLEKIYKQL